MERDRISAKITKIIINRFINLNRYGVIQVFDLQAKHDLVLGAESLSCI